MTLTTPGSLGWGGTANGMDQQVVDATGADQVLSVVDATGLGAGWHVTVSASQFTTATVPASTLANSDTLSLNGSVSSPSATAAPTAACATGSTCTLPDDTTTYPVAITTAATSPIAFTIYDAATSTGSGSIDIGSTDDPVGWWLNIPGNVTSGTYTSTITLELLATP